MKTSATLSFDCDSVIVFVTFTGQEVRKAFNLDTEAGTMVLELVEVVGDVDDLVSLAEIIYQKLTQHFNRKYAETVLKVAGVEVSNPDTGDYVEVIYG